MDLRFTHARIDAMNAAEDKLIAARLGHDPRLLATARRNLRRWMARDGTLVRPVFREWKRILEYLTVAELARFLRSDTPMVRRLRQSSPFAGVLTKAEQHSIRQKYDEL
jgi:hypothetical protein